MKIEDQLTNELQVTAKWLNENDLIINLGEGKTESMLFATSQRVQNHSLKVYLNENLIKRPLYKLYSVGAFKAFSLKNPGCIHITITVTINPYLSAL